MTEGMTIEEMTSWLDRYYDYLVLRGKRDEAHMHERVTEESPERMSWDEIYHVHEGGDQEHEHPESTWIIKGGTSIQLEPGMISGSGHFPAQREP